jgi:hypothetical protein
VDHAYTVGLIGHDEVLSATLVPHALGFGAGVADGSSQAAVLHGKISPEYVLKICPDNQYTSVRAKVAKSVAIKGAAYGCL